MAGFSSRRQVLGWAAALPLAGCGPDAPVDEAITTITWYASSMTGSHTDPRQSLIDAFQKAHPMIRVKLISAPTNTDEERDWLREAIPRGGGAPDLYLGDVIWPAEFADDGLALALNEHLPAAFWGRFDPELIDAATYRGKVYAAPFYVDQGVLMYRNDLVKDAPSTWQELSARASDLVKNKKVKHGFVWPGARYEGLTCVWTEFARAAGVADGLRIDTAEARRALAFMVSLLDSHASPAEITSYREPQALQIFKSREAAFFRTWNSAYVNMAADPSIGVAPLPAFAKGTRASAVGGWSLCVNPHTRHLREVLTFLQWMTDVPAQYTIAQYSITPTNKEIHSDPVVTGNPSLAAATGARPVSRPSGTPDYPAISKVIFSAVHRTLRHELAPPQALSEAQKEIDELPV